MPIAKTGQTTSILEYALHHLEKEAGEIQGKIDHIRRQLGQRVTTVIASVTPSASAAAAPRKKRVLSAAARKRIAAAQKKRWAEHRKATAKSSKSE